MHGPGKYDAFVTYVREQAQAEGVVLVVINGTQGNGFAVQGSVGLTQRLPDILETMAREIRADMQRTAEGIAIWTIYDHPTDYPDLYVARRFENERPTSDVITSTSLDWLRDRMRDAGRACIVRRPNDDPKIVETWL